MQLTQNSSNGIRSLICDNNGIIIAETVYRCMICSEIYDNLDDIQKHYQLEHFEDVLSETPINQLDVDYDNDEFDDNENLENLESTFYDQFNCDVSINNDVSSENDVNFIDCEKSTTNISKSNNTSVQNEKGGFVTCEVCGLTKYYSHISRRYGVFSCESCAKFFYRYSQKPVSYSCQNNGNCSLKIDMPGARCKACLLNACLNKYILDPKKYPKIFNNESSVVILDENNFDDAITSSVETNDMMDCNPSLKSKLASKPKNGSKTLSNKNSNSLLINSLLTDPNTNSDEIFVKKSYLRDKKIKSKSLLSNNIHQRKSDHLSDDIKMRFSKCRRVSCRMCDGCLADDCGECLYCLDKPKFGGNDIKKQKCLKRRCLLLK